MTPDTSSDIISTGAFLSARPRLKRVYAPKTHSAEKRKKVPVLSDGFLSWIIPTIKISENYVLNQTSLDSYMILRTLRFLRNFFLATSVISCIVILPINIKSNPETEDMSKYSAANLYKNSNYFWVHLTYYVITIALVLYILLRESALFIKLRQRDLLKSRYQKPEKAHTILISGLKNQYLNESYLKSIFDILPGGVKNVTVNKDASQLTKLIKKRDKILQDLEVTLTKYTISCEAAFKMANSKHGSSNTSTIAPPPLPHKIVFKPTQSSIFFSYQRVDTIELLSNQLLSINKEILDFKATKLDTLKNKSSAFITFNKQVSAHLAVQSIISQDLTSVTPKLLDTEYSDVIWSDISLNPYTKRFRLYISMLITVFIALTWGSLSISITALTNIDFLLEAFKIEPDKVNFLTRFNGFIPAMLLSILVSILPYFLQLLVNMEGRPRRSDIDFDVCNRFFYFLVFTVFILPQVSSSFKGIILKFTGILTNTKEVLDQVISFFISSNSLFLTYVVLKTFVSTSIFLIMIPSLLNRSVKPFFFAISPRQIYNAEKPTKFEWQTMIPQHLLVFLIGMNYSAITPLINPFCFLYFQLFYYIYMYKFKYIYDQDQFSLGGTSFVCILRQTFHSLFFVEVVWLLIMIANGITGASGIIRVVISAGVLFYTFGVYNSVKRSVFPYFYYLPVALHDSNPDFDSELLKNADLADNGANSYPEEKIISSPKEESSQKSETDMESSLGSEKSPTLQLPFSIIKQSKGGKLIPEISKGSQKVYSHLIDISKNILVTERNFKSRSFKSKKSKGRKSSSSEFDLDYSDINKQYINPAILTNHFSIVWVPLDESGLTDNLIQRLNELGEGYFSVASKGAFVNNRNKVGIDFDFDFTKFELSTHI
ncbi:hypothetical protein AYI68_g7000 [Smittium mucronatum]|uniref:Calcium permeable stress-gated cation channel 1 n=1 Tax=Smittium mucronatum TaxID=133383 RepID=A0A1R0GPX4_9FUNG|nr:hypothetical protein AYI68_g7000 [Smittium mucronatum]